MFRNQLLNLITGCHQRKSTAKLTEINLALLLYDYLGVSISFFLARGSLCM